MLWALMLALAAGIASGVAAHYSFDALDGRVDESNQASVAISVAVVLVLIFFASLA